MSKFLAILFFLLLPIVTCNPGIATQGVEEYYFAVYSSKDLLDVWLIDKYYPDLLYQSDSWTNFGKFLTLARKCSKNKPLLIDLDVHGNDGGLALKAEDRKIKSLASFGYVITEIEKVLKGKKFVLLVESCYAGNAYKNTIRNNNPEFLIGLKQGIEAFMTDYKKVPYFPIYGTGSGYSNVGNTMFLQYRYRYRKYWVDLRVYENMPAAEHESEDDSGWSKTTKDILKDYLFFRFLVP
jgi:hypothetical protein